ncbi:hypothetical protein [Piscinibacter gummiphilus]|uniref:DUF4304 domain-containing protein n=1 Tax=Piscinibacter gummiphilus TaxID=946333 RepID=A0ABZ0D248_9BURK|nr:hypothetical protein [Piscinibacter gummiphilus]WOB11258.1 hypothetical protein RXV79_26875 [Piscinibacter gummiphilus]
MTDEASVQLERVVRFLQGIGLVCTMNPGAHGFIHGVSIRHGSLQIDPFASPSSLLHEAGHLSIIPAKFRGLACDDLVSAFEVMFAETDFSDPDSPGARAAIQCSDPEATAWAWAAGRAVGLAPEVIIQDDEYDGTGKWIRMQLANGHYAGIHGLAHAGFCAVRESPLSRRQGLAVFPKLNRWLQN